MILSSTFKTTEILTSRIIGYCFSNYIVIRNNISSTSTPSMVLIKLFYILRTRIAKRHWVIEKLLNEPTLSSFYSTLACHQNIFLHCVKLTLVLFKYWFLCSHILLQSGHGFLMFIIQESWLKFVWLLLCLDNKSQWTNMGLYRE